MDGKRARANSLARLRVLRALIDDAGAPHYGRELTRRSGVGTGSLYPILVKLEADGLIEGEWEHIDEAAVGRRRRRYYVLSDHGRRYARKLLTEMAAELEPPVEEPAANRRVSSPGLAPA